MKFNWTREKWEKCKGVFLMTCYYTRPNGQKHSMIRLVESRYVGKLKADIEKNTRALPDGAWEPIEGASWTIHPDCRITIDDSQIRMLA